MNKMFAIVFTLLPLAGMAYVLWRTWHLLPFGGAARLAVTGFMLACLLVFFANFAVLRLDRLPMAVARVSYEVGNSAIFVLLYMAMLYLLLDAGRAIHVVPRSFMMHSVRGTVAVVAVIAGLFTYGYFHYMHKARQPLTLKTEKAPGQPLTIVMLSDLHLGYHNGVDELNRWVALVNREHPDLVLIGGDIIDGHMRPLNAEGMATALRRLQAPVVACLGNHEYYAGIDSAVHFYEEAGIRLLRDETITLRGINIVGRDDRTNPRRKSLRTLMTGVDRNRYTILLDHQPYHLEEAEHEGVDFQLSGHTHYGQVWPISWIEDAIYEDAYGPCTKGQTRYYVTSGMGIWGAKFRIGTRSEYLVARLQR